MNFSSIHRKDFVEQLASTQFDLLVIGGGITGCGIALDAALRGMKVALIEKNDFASGTSSRSTKLIHGGLRYLKQLEIKLVHDVGSERAVVHRNARHVVIPEKMLLPIVENGSLGKNSSSLGLLVYDLLAGVKKDERRKMLNKHDTLKAEPLLAKDKLVGGGLYFEYRTDDSRLTIEIAKSAFANGTTLLNYAESKGFVYNSDKKITGAKVIDTISGQEFEIKASVVVNACGPWVDLLRKEDNSLKGKRLLLTKGVHLVFPYEKLPLQQAAYFDVGDGRMIFAIPRNSITYVGTTDTVYNQSIDKPQCSKEDVEYLLKAVNNIFPTLQLKQQDIVSSWAGLRPLIFEDGKSASEVSRKDEIMISDSGLISIAGGKLTGYRLMAEKIVDLTAKHLGKNFGGCQTKTFRLSGGEFVNEEEFETAYRHFLQQGTIENIGSEKIRDWFFRYGKNTAALITNVIYLRSKFSNEQELFDAAELQYGVEHELVFKLSDFLIRRTGKIFFDRVNTLSKLDYLSSLLSERLQTSESSANIALQAVKEEFSMAVTFE
ncbi:MAG: glycerol-3-phosphate dehydrogenase/oxidase [Chitinophagales bacterium]|nr:glycerol-3-phosphate dehydrogenase/oxidase [Chitinophagales bacterium]